jgi:hypothetical protein
MNYALSIANTKNYSVETGLYVQGFKYAIFANQEGVYNGDEIAIYSTDMIEAEGYRSRQPSSWWTLGLNGVPDTGLTMKPSASGMAVITATATGTKKFYLPITLPGMLMGQEIYLLPTCLQNRGDVINYHLTTSKQGGIVNVDDYRNGT